MVMCAIWDIFFEGRVQYIKSRKIYNILHEQSCVIWLIEFLRCNCTPHSAITSLIALLDSAITKLTKLTISCVFTPKTFN